MKLNREQIIKALECCKNGIVTDCETCPRYDIDADTTRDCMEGLMREAFSLIKELTEENERLRANNLTFAHGVEKVAANYYNLGCADTVRKMHERLKAKAYTNNYCQEVVLESDIDQIAKEMLEEIV